MKKTLLSSDYSAPENWIEILLKTFFNMQWTCILPIYTLTQARKKGGVGREEKVECVRTPS